mgnify:CR=1 FL=1
MLHDITIGQYFPLNSKVHKLDPRVKLFYTLVYIIMVFVCNNFVALFMTLLSVILLTIFSKIPFKTIFKSLKPIVLIILITSLLQIIYVKSGIVLIDWWKIKITSGGLLQALFMTIRVSLLIVMSSLFTYTTSPTAMTNGLDRLFAPLTKIGIDFNVVTMIMTIALRFIPTLIDEVDKIMSAQKSRGANFESGSLMKRTKMLIPLFVPLLFNSIKRAYDLAYAMTCRCYNGGKGRTTMNALKLRLSDYIMLVLSIAFIAGVILLNKYCGEYNAEFTFGITL